MASAIRRASADLDGDALSRFQSAPWRFDVWQAGAILEAWKGRMDWGVPASDIIPAGVVRGVAFPEGGGIDDLIVTSDMAERKAKMIELGDAFIAFPGGTGTLEEIAEVMSAVSLGHLSAPCILYNLDGYYNDLKALLGHMIDKGLSSPRRQHGIYFADDLREIASIVNG